MLAKIKKYVVLGLLAWAPVFSHAATAAVDQSWHPARCHIFGVCRTETFSPVTISVASAFPFNEGEVCFSGLTLDYPGVSAGWFSSLQDVQEQGVADLKRNFGAVIWPSRDAADAFGISVCAGMSTSGWNMISTRVTKVSCSNIGRGTF